MTGRERFLAACRNLTVDRPPIWLMRQAGRYLPEYRALRHTHSFWDMVRTPEVAVEATLQPIRRFGMDAAILFSDILIVLDALGVTVRYEEGGPVITPLVSTAEDVAALRPVDAGVAFAYVDTAIRSLVAELHPGTAVIGFAGAPFTLAAYAVEGGPSKHVDRLKALAYTNPELYAALATRIADVVADLLIVQARAGADAVQLFDTWAWHLGPDDYRALALPYTRRVVERVRATTKIPIILYVRNAAGHLAEAASAGGDVLSVDGSIRLADASRRLRAGIALQGNLDPALLAAPTSRIREAVAAGLAATRGRGWIVNLGQGLTPQSPIAGVEALVTAVREVRP
jgi:uroporphyrinogen decarboxylase